MSIKTINKNKIGFITGGDIVCECHYLFNNVGFASALDEFDCRAQCCEGGIYVKGMRAYEYVFSNKTGENPNKTPKKCPEQMKKLKKRFFICLDMRWLLVCLVLCLVYLNKLIIVANSQSPIKNLFNYGSCKLKPAATGSF